MSPRSVPGFEAVQRRLLEREGVAFGADDRVDLERYRWSASPSQRKGWR